MKRIAAILLALLLTLTLLFTACGPRAEQTPQPADRPEEGIDLVIVTDAPTDQTPTDVHANAPPETAEPEAPETTTQAPGTAAEETPAAEAPATEAPAPDEPAAIDEDGWYYSKEDVALYIHTYGRLPGNFITKKEAKKLGWSSGSLEKYAPGKAIGGDRFGNYEGLLPEAKGRYYTECDIDTKGAKKRGAKRIVFSNDGLIYYTDDHYEHFTLLYGEE